jgi:hypothetical protein
MNLSLLALSDAAPPAEIAEESSHPDISDKSFRYEKI